MTYSLVVSFRDSWITHLALHDMILVRLQNCVHCYRTRILAIPPTCLVELKKENILGIIVWNLEEFSYKPTVTVCICAPKTSIQGHFLFTYTEAQLRTHLVFSVYQNAMTSCFSEPTFAAFLEMAESINKQQASAVSAGARRKRM